AGGYSLEGGPRTPRRWRGGRQGSRPPRRRAPPGRCASPDPWRPPWRFQRLSHIVHCSRTRAQPYASTRRRRCPRNVHSGSGLLTRTAAPTRRRRRHSHNCLFLRNRPRRHNRCWLVAPDQHRLQLPRKGPVMATSRVAVVVLVVFLVALGLPSTTARAAEVNGIFTEPATK